MPVAMHSALGGQILRARQEVHYVVGIIQVSSLRSANFQQVLIQIKPTRNVSNI